MSRIDLPKDPKERLKYLESMCDDVLEDKFFKKLTSEEIAEIRTEFTDNALKIDDLADEKAEYMQDFKEREKPLKETHSRLAKQVKTGYKEVVGSLYKFVDHSIRMTFFYDKDGNMIETKTRPATDHELSQLTISHSRRNGTND